MVVKEASFNKKVDDDREEDDEDTIESIEILNNELKQRDDSLIILQKELNQLRYQYELLLNDVEMREEKIYGFFRKYEHILLLQPNMSRNDSSSELSATNFDDKMELKKLANESTDLRNKIEILNEDVFFFLLFFKKFGSSKKILNIFR